jgi:hypothetical protein
MAEQRLPAVQWMSTAACGWSSSTRAAKHAAAHTAGRCRRPVILHRHVRDPFGAKHRPLGRQIPRYRTSARGRQFTTCVTPCPTRPASARADGTPLIAIRSSPIQLSNGPTAPGPGAHTGTADVPASSAAHPCQPFGITVIFKRC